LSINIAIAEKGGTGKITVTSLVIRYLKDNGKGPILAVDADPNANVGEGYRHAASWISPVGWGFSGNLNGRR